MRPARYPAADGWKRSGPNTRWGAAANSGPSRSPSDTVRPPASTSDDGLGGCELAAPMPGHSRAAGRPARSCRDPGRCRRPHGTPIDRCSSITVCSSSRTEVDGRTRWVTSLAPIMMTATSGRWGSASASCPVRSADVAPILARMVSRTGRPAASARPPASSAPGVSSGWFTPNPAAVESPSNTRPTGSPEKCGPYSPSATGGSVVGSPIQRRASLASRMSTPAVAALSRPSPPPPNAAATAIRRAWEASVTRYLQIASEAARRLPGMDFRRLASTCTPCQPSRAGNGRSPASKFPARPALWASTAI